MKISVVIPLYNKRGSILETIETVLLQTKIPDEIIVVNDGSTDGSEILIEKLNHCLVKLIYQENAGVSAARNTGIVQAKSEWIAFLDADDQWKPSYLKEMEYLSSSFPDCNVLASAYEIKNSKGNTKSIELNKLPFEGEMGELSNYFQVAHCSHPPICSIAIIAKKVSLLDIEGFPIGVKSGEDLLTWARLAIHNKIAYINKPLATFILDPSHEVSSVPSRLHDKYDAVGNTLIELDKEFGPKGMKKYISHWYKMRVSVCIRSMDRGNGIKYSLKSLQYNFFNFKIYLFIGFLLLPTILQKKMIKKYSL